MHDVNTDTDGQKYRQRHKTRAARVHATRSVQVEEPRVGTDVHPIHHTYRDYMHNDSDNDTDPTLSHDQSEGSQLVWGFQ